MTRTACASLLAVTYLALVGCASLPPNQKRDARDPWERMNRTTFKVNTALDHAVLRPVARTYEKITPRPVRDSVSNFVDNLSIPVTLANDLLQLRLKNFAQDTGRFVLNTTVGVGGLFDPASTAGLPKNESDLGQTFGRWGAGPGPYFVIPLLGPSDVRDGLGHLGDIWLNPLSYLNNDYNYIRYSIGVVAVVDIRYRLLPQDKLLEEAYDPYTLLKNAYLQRREYQINGGKQSTEQQKDELDEEKRILEEAGADDDSSKGPAPKDQTPPDQAPKDQPPK